MCVHIWGGGGGGEGRGLVEDMNLPVGDFIL